MQLHVSLFRSLPESKYNLCAVLWVNISCLLFLTLSHSLTPTLKQLRSSRVLLWTSQQYQNVLCCDRWSLDNGHLSSVDLCFFVLFCFAPFLTSPLSFLCRLKTLSQASNMRLKVSPSELSKASWPRSPVLWQVSLCIFWSADRNISSVICFFDFLFHIIFDVKWLTSLARIRKWRVSFWEIHGWETCLCCDGWSWNDIILSLIFPLTFRGIQQSLFQYCRHFPLAYVLAVITHNGSYSEPWPGDRKSVV